MHRSITVAAATALALLATAAGAQEFNLDALAEAAKAEPPTNVYAVTGKVVEQAEAFSRKYGLNVTGKKVNEAGQIDLLIREHQAGNVQGSVSLAADTSEVAASLIPQGIVESWAPPDIAPFLPEADRDPLVVVSDVQVWAYNSETYDKCPVSNVWELTEPEWSRRVTLLDPLEKPNLADWFNQMAEHHEPEMRAAYEAHFGKPFEGENAAEAWVRAFAANGPLLADSGSVAEAIGAPGQAEPMFGMVATAKFRDNAAKGLKLAICSDIQPFAGWLYPGLGVIATDTPAPNTAKLFIHYLMTAEGIAPQTVDGKLPSDPRIGLPADEPSGLAAQLDRMMPWDTTGAQSDLDRRQDWQDLWRTEYKR